MKFNIINLLLEVEKEIYFRLLDKEYDDMFSSGFNRLLGI